MRLRQRDFSRGLFLSGPREQIPEGFVRRGRGAPQVLTSSFRSRPGSTKLFDLAAHSLFRFNGVRFAGVNNLLYRDGIQAATFAFATANRLAFVPAPPVAGQPDWLFITGHDPTGIKVSQAGQVEGWGIVPPLDGAAGALHAVETLEIDTFDGEAGGFTLVTGSDTGSAVSNEGTITIGGGSLRMNLPQNVSVAWQRSFGASLNLTQFADTTLSTDEDYIEMWVHLANPGRIEQITLAFWVGEVPSAPGDVVNNLFSREILIEDTVTQKQVRKERGLGDLVPISNQDQAFMDLQHPHPEMLSLQEQLGTQKAVATRHTWTRLRMPKSTFHRSGSSAAGWEDIRGIQIGVRTNHIGPANTNTNVYFDACELVGGVGMQGDYQYLFTFLNAVTGTRSNPNLTPLVVTGAVRQGIDLSGLPVSTDSQVTDLEIWRTLGNGAIFFKCAQVPFGTTTFADRVADYIGLRSAGPVLSDETLPRDNIYPGFVAARASESAFVTGARDAVGPHYGRIFWCRDGGAGSGRVYYSPADRAEGVEGFLEVTNEDDPTQKLVKWNDTLYLLTQLGCYEILGTDTPFVARKVLGVPGTTLPFTVAACPDGVYYASADGIRRFDGVTSVRVAFEAVAPIFQGQSAGDYTPFNAVVGAYAHGEYMVSDGLTQMLAWDLGQQRWRDPGAAPTAIYFETDTGLTIVSFAGKIFSFEDPAATTDDGDPIPISLEPPAGLDQAAQQAVVQWLYVEARTGGQTLTAALVREDDEMALPPFSTPGQARVEYQLLVPALIWAAHIAGSIVKPIEIFGVEFDTHVMGSRADAGLSAGA